MKRLVVFFALLAGCNERPLGPVTSSSAPLCEFDRGDSRATLASLNDRSLSLVRGDGTSTAAFVFTQAAARNFYGQALVARGDWVAAAAGWVDEAGTRYSADAVLIDRSGQVRWQGSRANAGGGYLQLYLNDRGHLAVDFGGSGVLVDPSGGERALEGLAPIAAPTDDGSVAVRQAPQGEAPGVIGWVRAGADSVTPLGLPPDRYFTPIMVAGRLTYLSQGEGGTLLVSELPGDARTVLLPGIDASAVTISDSSPAGWVLIGAWRMPQYLVNVRTLEARPIGVSTPAGFRPFMGALSGPLLDSDGALLLGLRDAYAGALYRSSDGRNWQQVGATVTNVLDIDPLARSGTYLINATSGRYSLEEWTPAPPDHTPDYDGDLIQVVRPQAGVAQKLSLGTMWAELSGLRLSNDGRCVAFTDADGQLTALDVERQKTFPLAIASSNAAFAWIE